MMTIKNEPIPTLITPDDVAKHLQVSLGTVYRWVRNGSIPHLRLGHTIRFNLEEVNKWARNTPTEVA